MTIPSIASQVDVRPATQADRDSIAGLLKIVGLPDDELDLHLPHFLIAYCNGRIAGCGGMELYGDTAVLRSLAVYPEYRRLGIGGKLTKQILSEASRAGASQAVLLTHAAENLARSFGFAEIAREVLPKAVLESWEFRSSCCCAAKCFRLQLTGG